MGRCAWTPDADVVLLDLGGVVGPGWREQLRSAAYADTVIATSSAVPADLLAIHDRSSEHSRLTAAGSVHRATGARGTTLGLRLRPSRRAQHREGARWLANDHQNASPPRIEDVVQVPGLVHVLASAVVVPTAGRPLHDRRSALTPAARRALTEIEADVEPLRVTVDLRCCSGPLERHSGPTRCTSSSLSAQEALRVRVLPFRGTLHDSVQPYLEALPSSVSRQSAGQPTVTPPHIFHRPYQIFNEREITEVFTAVSAWSSLIKT